MDNIATILVAVLAICVVSFVVYRIARSSGDSTRPGVNDRPSTRNPTDYR
jgi:hypothetical protein